MALYAVTLKTMVTMAFIERDQRRKKWWTPMSPNPNVLCDPGNQGAPKALFLSLLGVRAGRLVQYNNHGPEHYLPASILLIVDGLRC